jgi:hypothetical protein
METCQLREKTLTEKDGTSRIGGGWRSVDNPTQKYDLSRNPKKKRRPEPTQGCRPNNNDDDDDDNSYIIPRRLIHTVVH